MTDELKALLEQTKDHVMSPAEIQAQRESWVRAMAPCEHGIADFEDCCQCREPSLWDPKPGACPVCRCLPCGCGHAIDMQRKMGA